MNNALRFLICLILNFMVTNCFSGVDDKTKADMISNLEFIKRTLEVQYAPLEWKKEFMNWDIEDEFTKAIDKVLYTDTVTTKNYQQIIKEFLGSTQDYHVQITFFSTEFSFLPFSVKTINQKCFVDWVDDAYWPEGQVKLNQGDEILFFGGRPVEEVIEEIKIANGRRANTATDQALADHTFTLRLGTAGNEVVNGDITILVRTPMGETKALELDWTYQPEKITSPNKLHLLLDMLEMREYRNPVEEKLKSLFHKLCMVTPLNHLQIKERELRHGELGASKSSLPFLGKPIRVFEAKRFNEPEVRNSSGEIKPRKKINWFAYIYKNSDEKLIGYLRIPHYLGDDEDFFNCIPIIAYLEKHTDALVVDQLNNPGGYVSFMNQLLSLLTPYPLTIPKHRVAINQKEVMEAIKEIDELNDYVNFNFSENFLQQEGFRKIMNYYSFILEEWNNGRTLTDPVHLGGVEMIPPYRVHYSKPILMLINELDFSAGDFAPAILQDNRRATLMGRGTAGAGGAVSDFSFPNRYGIKEISFTNTIAERNNLQKIENLGVIPEIKYDVTEEDLRSGYQNFKDAINIAISELLDSNL